MIKINTLVRTQEDEKSKANALKISETKLTATIDQLNAQIEDLKKENENLTLDLGDKQGNIQNLSAEQRELQGNI